MKQTLRSLKDGITQLTKIPAHSAMAGHVLIHTTTSLASAGTEHMLERFRKAKAPVYQTLDELAEVDVEANARPGQRLKVGFNYRFPSQVVKANFPKLPFRNDSAFLRYF